MNEHYSSEIFDQFFKFSIDLLCIADMQGYFRKLNPEWKRTLGYSVTDMEGKKFIEFVHPDDVEKTIKATNALAKDQTVHNFVNRYRHKDGSYRWIEWRSFPSAGMIYASARDITEKIRAEQSLKESEERNRLVSSLIVDYVFRFEVDEKKNYTLTYISENFAELTGRAIDEARDIGSWSEIFYPDDFPKLQEFIQQILSGTRPGELECRSLTKGKIRWLSIYAKPEIDKKTGRVVSVTGAVKDISDKKTAEMELRQSEEKFRSIVEHSLAGIFTVNENFRFIYVNDEFCKIVCHTHEEMIGMDFRKLLSPKSLEMVIDRYIRRQKGEVVPHRYELDIIRGDGRIRQAEMLVNVILDNEGKPRSMGQLIDITDRKKMESDLLESESRLRSFIDESSEGIVIINEDGLVEEWNKSAERITGHKKKKILNNPWWEIDKMIMTEDVLVSQPTDLMEKQVKATLKSGKLNMPAHSEYPFKHASGVIRYMAHHLFTVKTGKGFRIAGILNDITDRITTENKLKLAEEIFATSFKTSPDAISITRNSDQKFIEVNEGFRTVTGYSAEDITGKSSVDIELWEYPEERQGLIDGIKKDGKISNMEVHIRSKNGSVKTGLMSATLITLQGESCILSITRDITEKKLAEKELADTKALLSAAIMQTPIPMVIVSAPDLTIQMANNACAEFLGIENVGEYMGKSLLKIDPVWQDFDEFGNLLPLAEMPLALALNGTETKNKEFFVKRRDGSIRWELVNSSPIRNKEGEIIAAFLVFPDITDSKMARETILKNAREMERLMQSMANAFVMWENVFDENKKIINVRFAYINDAYERLSGVRFEQIRGKFVTEVFPETEQAWFDIFNEIIITGKAKSFEMFFTPTKAIYACTAYLPWDTTDRICVVFEDVTEKRNSENRIKQLAALHQTILDTVFAGLTYVKDRKIEWTNNALNQMFGYEEKELTGKYTSLIYLNEHEYLRIGKEAYPKLAEGDVYSTEMQGRKKDGSLIWVQLTGKAMNSEDPMSGSVWMLLDVTERKNAELALIRNESILKATMESMNDGILVVASDGKITNTNTRFIQIFSIPDELLQMNNDEILINYVKKQLKYPDEFTQHIEGIYRSSSPSEDILYFNDGRIVERLSFPLTEGSPFTGRVWLFRDITERKNSEEALIKSQKLLSESQRIAHIGCWENNLIDKKIVWNQETFKIYGFDYINTQFEYEDFIKLIHPDDLAFVASSHEEVIQTGRFKDQEYRIIRPNGEIRTVLVVGSVELNEDHKPCRSFGIIQDITERKKAEAEILKLNQKLEKLVEERTAKLNEAIKDLESFAYSVSHDLRAPVRHIDGFIKLMYAKIKKPEDSIKEYFKKINAATLRMTTMIDSLLAFSRLGRKELNISEVDLEPLVHEIIDQFKPDIANRTINWKISGLPVVHCDKNLIKLVFENLISNAIKYTTKKQKAIIEIGSEPESKDHVMLYVKDNGAGFDMTYSNKLFGVFQRLHNTEDYEGIGIGLANVRQIIEKHKWTIRAEGKVNKGACFFITIPTN